MGCAGLRQLTLLLAFSLALSAASVAQVQTDNMLTNGDIVRMMKAGIPESIIVREIQLSETNFVTSANALIELKRQHVSDGILNAMLDSRSGASGRQAEPPPMVGTQSAAPHPHHLPTFNAAMRLDSRTMGKVSMSQNHIKVEKSGQPLFTLTWKSPRSQ